MEAEIITIGDEILIGQITDTNSARISKLLDKIGISVVRMTSISDRAEIISEALSDAEKRADLIILTGGLGPTKDDVTKNVFCDYFQDVLVENKEVLSHIEHLFKKYLKRAVSQINRMQALVPSKALVLMNRFGTAPGMWMEKSEKVFVSLPGVPTEMMGLMENEVIPTLLSKFKFPYITHKTLMTYGIGESTVADRLDAWEDALPDHIKLAYLPNFGMLRLRLSGKGTNKEEIDKDISRYQKELKVYIDDYFVGYEDDGGLVSIVGKILSKTNKTLAVAESCTGGALAKAITAIPGASQYFKGGVVCYTEGIKTDVLNVSKSLIEQNSVVSAEVAEALANGVRAQFTTDYGIGITGNAGPTVDKNSRSEVGEVFISVVGPNGTITERNNFGVPRQRVIDNSTSKALDLLRKSILE